MPRSQRRIPPNSVLHVINRGNDRRRLFRSGSEYEEFRALMRHTAGLEPLRIVGYVLMPNHWHMVVWPETGAQLSRYMQVLGTNHAMRWRRRDGQLGEGHVYQGRYHAFVIESDRQFFNVLRYVEANPVRAGLVARAKDWPWSSLAERQVEPPVIISPSPLPLPPDWLQTVDQTVPPEVLADLQLRTRRPQCAAWQPTRHNARRQGFESV